MRLDERGVVAIGDQQRFVSSSLDDLAEVHDDDLVAVPNGRQAVGDDQAGAAASPQVIHHALLGRGVECTRGFVKHQERRVLGQRSRNFEPLPLSAAEVASALVERAVVSALPRGDVVVDAGVLGGADQVAVGDRRVPECQIVADRALEHHDRLIDQGQRVAQLGGRTLGARLSVEQDLTRLGFVQSADEARNGRLTAARSADQGNAPSGFDRQVEVVDERLGQAAVSKRDAAQFEVSGQAGGHMARVDASAHLDGVGAAHRTVAGWSVHAVVFAVAEHVV